MTEPVEGKCNANKKSGGLCTQPAGAGTDHLGFGNCKWHTGSTPAGRMSAAKKELETRRLEALAYGINAEVDIEPHQALLEEVRRTAGHVGWLGLKIGVGEEGDLVQSTEKGLVPSVWVSLYQQERAQLVRVSKVAIDCGVAERQVAIAEEQGRQLATVISTILDRLELSEAQKSRAPQIVRGILLAQATGALEPPETIDV